MNPSSRYLIIYVDSSSSRDLLACSPWLVFIISCIPTQPWVHYVPLKPDMSDLVEKLEQCEADLPRCEAIAKRATDYIR